MAQASTCITHTGWNAPACHGRQAATSQTSKRAAAGPKQQSAATQTDTRPGDMPGLVHDAGRHRPGLIQAHIRLQPSYGPGGPTSRLCHTTSNLWVHTYGAHQVLRRLEQLRQAGVQEVCACSCLTLQGRVGVGRPGEAQQVRGVAYSKACHSKEHTSRHACNNTHMHSR